MKMLYLHKFILHCRMELQNMSILASHAWIKLLCSTMNSCVKKGSTVNDCSIDYNITTMSASVGQIKSAVWAMFTETV